MHRPVSRNAFLAALALAAVLVAPARAGIEAAYDNDTHGMVPSPRATDRNYTFGMHAQWHGQDEQLPRWTERFARRLGLRGEDAHTRLALAAGQEVYTPDSLSDRNPILNDRPYAAWLWAGATISRHDVFRERSLDVRLGMIGPSAQGQEIQTWWHRRNHIRLPRGWKYQLADEPGLRASLEQRWRPWGRQRHIDLVPHVRATAGNVLTEAVAGGTLRIGLPLPDDFGPGSAGGPDQRATGFHVLLWGNADAHAIARDIFLDGNTFASSQRVHRVPLVRSAEAGATLGWHQLAVRYTFSYTSQQFRERKDYQEYGSIALAF